MHVLKAPISHENHDITHCWKSRKEGTQRYVLYPETNYIHKDCRLTHGEQDKSKEITKYDILGAFLYVTLLFSYAPSYQLPFL